MIPIRYQPLEAVKRGRPLKARDLETAQTVVLHMVTGLQDGGAAVIARAAVVRGLSHPFLLTLVDCLKLDDRTVLLASEFVPARSLSAICAGQPLHLRRASEIVAEVADGVAELHARAFAHAALSIDSVLVTDKGRGKVDLVSAVGAVGPGWPGQSGGAGRAGEAGEGEFESDVRALVALLKEITARPIVGLRHLTSAPLLAAHLRTHVSS
ncbi:MAG: protein kinase [Vicinamibacterales bacterium]